MTGSETATIGRGLRRLRFSLIRKKKRERERETTEKKDGVTIGGWKNGSKLKPLMRLTDVKSKCSFRGTLTCRLFAEKRFFSPASPPSSAFCLSCHPLVTTYLNNVTKARKREKSYSPLIRRGGKSERCTSTNLICLSEGGTILFWVKARAKCLEGRDERSIFEIRIIVLS